MLTSNYYTVEESHHKINEANNNVHGIHHYVLQLYQHNPLMSPSLALGVMCLEDLSGN